ncbi:MAG: tetratricopeptide repeat protein [Candidatus Sumerlaeia bacterium]|nr:tetratricopeptide repeat protein [Candidatus Sumerlaeia bacterium]
MRTLQFAALILLGILALSVAPAADPTAAPPAPQQMGITPGADTEPSPRRFLIHWRDLDRFLTAKADVKMQVGVEVITNALGAEKGRYIGGDPSRALELLLDVALEEEPSACAMVAMATACGCGFRVEDPSIPQEYWEIALEAEEPFAMTIEGTRRMRFAPLRLPTYEREAISMIEKGYAAGYPKATYELFHVYYWDSERFRDREKGLKLLEEAIEQEFPEAFRSMGYLYTEGLIEKKDAVTAFKYYLRAAELGDPMSMFNVGLNYRYGRGVSQEIQKAMEFFEMGIAAGSGDAMGEAGDLLWETSKSLEDRSRAVHYLVEAAADGNSNACKRLCWIFGFEEGWRDEEAFAYYANRGALREVDACRWYLALAYFAGWGVETNYEAARFWLDRMSQDSLHMSRSALHMLMDSYESDTGLIGTVSGKYDLFNLNHNSTQIGEDLMPSGYKTALEYNAFVIAYLSALDSQMISNYDRFEYRKPVVNLLKSRPAYLEFWFPAAAIYW